MHECMAGNALSSGLCGASDYVHDNACRRAAAADNRECVIRDAYGR